MASYMLKYDVLIHEFYSGIIHMYGVVFLVIRKSKDRSHFMERAAVAIKSTDDRTISQLLVTSCINLFVILISVLTCDYNIIHINSLVCVAETNYILQNNDNKITNSVLC